jgi:hypothetical protein
MFENVFYFLYETCIKVTVEDIVGECFLNKKFNCTDSPRDTANE